MTKIAWVFPGQGSQTQGMGLSLNETVIGKQKFAQAQEILGWSVLEVCEAGDERLSQTIYTQPCLYTVECILVDLQKQEGKQPDLVAGHSLGEYVALYAAGVYDFAQGLQLVKRRAELMSTAQGGKMVALMKFDRDILEGAIASNPDVVIANDNSEGQVVISGKPEAIDQVLEQVQAKKAVELNVSGAFHSPFMASAATEFVQVLDTITFNDATTPIMSNVDPIPSTSAPEIKQRLIAQMTGGVRWREIMLNFPHHGITDVVEVGPGKVLTGLIKRTNKELNLTNISG
ncbi:ACP S-malonyltransferase [Cyanobacterium stanieri LEGE 03274]|uniref:Malonyl CoA-acyl carrier protein transacylase n=1 Tax=Cyanobacterium stanieri LEGE 03274 TaxID=1828756 RepID=A0ABR9V290_9CHRO|nr:ACP S-malonyltransferase [Cyanobacterium stanieri]MBE9222014.1 ACP S-malonyltransferase [Cyanobacterium stanieri LEGE 03274]